MKVSVFAYKGILGIETKDFDPKSDILLNDPTQPGQLGFVVDASKIHVSQEAKDLMLTIPKSGDDIGDVDCFETSNGMTVFAWLGGPLAVKDPKKCSLAHDSKMNLLTVSEDIEIPEGFKNYVDNEI